MVGNDVGDDMVAGELGMKVFLLADCLINKTNKDISTNDWKRFDKNKNRVPDLEPYETIDRTF